MTTSIKTRRLSSWLKKVNDKLYINYETFIVEVRETVYIALN